MVATNEMKPELDPDEAAAQICGLLEAVINRFEQNDSLVAHYDREQGDLNHLIELTTFNASQGFQLSKRIKENRQKRRLCKNENIVLRPLYELIKKNGDQMVNEFRRVKKATEKQRSYLERQKYWPRTGAVTLEEVNT